MLVWTAEVLRTLVQSEGRPWRSRKRRRSRISPPPRSAEPSQRCSMLKTSWFAYQCSHHIEHYHTAITSCTYTYYCLLLKLMYVCFIESRSIGLLVRLKVGGSIKWLMMYVCMYVFMYVDIYVLTVKCLLSHISNRSNNKKHGRYFQNYKWFRNWKLQ